MKQFLALPYEIWRDVKGYEGLYQVSNLGRVKSLERVVICKDGRIKVIKGKILKPLINRYGYLYIYLYKNGKQKHFSIHRLVAEAFKPNPHNHPTVDHINRIRTDNRADNLRWAPYKLQAENRDGESIVKSLKKMFSIPVKQYTLDMVFIKEYPSAREASRQTGIKQGGISLCCKGQRKSAGGYIWEYADTLHLD